MSEVQTVREYNAVHVGKAWRIVAMTINGAAYCADCSGSWPLEETLNDDAPMPVFASDDTDGITCDACHGAVQ